MPYLPMSMYWYKSHADINESLMMIVGLTLLFRNMLVYVMFLKIGILLSRYYLIFINVFTFGVDLI